MWYGIIREPPRYSSRYSPPYHDSLICVGQIVLPPSSLLESPRVSLVCVSSHGFASFPTPSKPCSVHYMRYFQSELWKTGISRSKACDCQDCQRTHDSTKRWLSFYLIDRNLGLPAKGCTGPGHGRFFSDLFAAHFHHHREWTIHF